MAATVTPFGTRQDGRAVQAITLHDAPLRATILTHGAVLQSLYLDGHAHSLTLGAPEIAPYEADMAYFGAIIAPVANRIAGAQAKIAGRTHRFQANEGANSLHSGDTGAHGAIWDIADHGTAHVTLALDLPDGAGGFPGNRRLRVTYRLGEGALHLDITATSDAPTLMNIAHHGYWNLDGTPTWAGHTLQIAADHVLEVDDALIPTGTVQDLTGHPHDFRTPRVIQPGAFAMIDHNFCLSPTRRALSRAVTLTGARGITLELDTTEPGVQVFDATGIGTGALPTVQGHPYGSHCGLALEPQVWPDAPHHGHFPQITLDPGDTYHQISRFRFAG